MRHLLVRAIVGSTAHGLAGPGSDVDVKEVYAQDTGEFFVIGDRREYATPKASKPLARPQGAVDFTQYEVGHFLHLATKSNPSVLEVMKTPLGHPEVVVPWRGAQLLDLFPHVWNSHDVYHAFRGYGMAQRRRMQGGEGDARDRKYACAWLRTLYNACDLLATGSFSMDVTGTKIEPILRQWRNLDEPFSQAEATALCEVWEGELDRAFLGSPEKRTEYGPINDFIISVRKELFS